MLTDLDLLQAIASGELLASYRGVDYVKVCAVFKLPHDANGSAAFYCETAAWPDSPIGEIAARDTLISGLQRRVAELQAALDAATRVPPTVALAATGMEAPPPGSARADSGSIPVLRLRALVPVAQKSDHPLVAEA
jgi:hypothetical protein